MIGPRVLAFAADEGGCGCNRVIWPGRALEQAGYDVTVLHGEENTKVLAVWQDDADGEAHIVDLERVPDAEVVVLQRPVSRRNAELLVALQRRGVAVVVEVDDNFGAIHPQNTAYRLTHPSTSPLRNYRHLRFACDLADWVTTTTPALAAVYGGHGRVSVIPNYVPERYLAVKHPGHEVPVIGWSGAIDTHPHDLEQVGGALAEVVRRDLAAFQVVGTGTGVAQRLGLRGYELEASGWVEIDRAYPAAMASIDIGLVPLDPSPFNEGKSWLKGLEFAALAAPFVASPTGPYRELHEAHGLGRLASRPRGWRAALLELLAAHREFGAAHRETVRAHDLTYEAQAWQWHGAWSLALKRRAGLGTEVRA